MDGGVYIGRTRRPLSTAIWSILSLGIYGRVALYKTVREIDGHDARFLDLHLYLAGVILPIGPVFVKWRLADLLEETVRHDVSARAVPVRRLRIFAFIPWVPVHLLMVLRHLNPHWALHRRIQDLEGRKMMLEDRLRTARTATEKAELERVRADLLERERDLEEARQASMALREAEHARQRAEREIQERKRGRASILARFRRRKAPEDAEEPPGERSLFRRRRKTPEEDVPETAKAPLEAPEPAPERKMFGRRTSPEPTPAPEPVPESPEPTKRSFFRRLRKAAPPESEPEAALESPPAPEPIPEPAPARPAKPPKRRRS